MNKELNVVSLFNGIGCIWVALDRSSHKVNKRYSSEVDKYAIKINDKNYPDTVQLGDVRNVKGKDLGFIDLLGGGSPCQSFSFAGKRKGMSTKCEIEITTLEQYLELKSQDFEFEGQSYLFWEYIRILNELREINPNIKFLLENVIMSGKWKKTITQAIGINPICINSSLVSAQNRKRLYWTNIGTEKNGLFGDLKCNIVLPKNRNIFLKDILDEKFDYKLFIKDISELEQEDLVFKKNFLQLPGYRIDNQIFYENQKHGTLDCEPNRPKVLLNNGKIRMLSSLEIERLQTLPDEYTNGITEAQRHKAIGNGWTVDVIAHIFSYL